MLVKLAATLRHMRWLAGRGARTAGALMLMAISAHAMADSVTFPSHGMPNLSFAASLSSPRDARVGTVLQWVEQNVGLSASATCNVQKAVTVNGTPVPGMPMTFQTNVPGIGVNFYETNGWNGSYVQVPVTQTLANPSGTTQHWTRADLVVTGPVSSGTLTSLPSMTTTFTGSCIAPVTATQYLTPGTLIAASSCTVNTSAIAVTLPQGRVSAMPNIGSTTGATPFNIQLNCSAGVNVKLTLTDASNASNTSTTLGLAAGSTAAGVGLQILHGPTLVAYGPDSQTAGNMNQWSAGAAAGGSMTIPLTVQYIRTGASPTPGKVVGLATFTMSYQ
jgi:type 1 fimbria pilin